jgi:hypothetical protein
VGVREKVGACCLFLGAQALRGKHCDCARLILMFFLFCLDARLNEGFFLFPCELSVRACPLLV